MRALQEVGVNLLSAEDVAFIEPGQVGINIPLEANFPDSDAVVATFPGNAKVGALQIRRLSNLDNLRVLDFSGCQLSPEAFQLLRNLDSVDFMSLAGSNVNDGAFSQLAEIQSLKRVAIRNTSVSLRAVAIMNARRPDLKIITWP